MDKTGLSRKKITRTRHMISFFLVVILGIGTGLLGGAKYISDYLKSNQTYLTEEEIRENEKSVIDKYYNSPVSSLSAVNAFIIAEYKLSEYENLSMDAVGSVDAATQVQSIYTKKYRTGDQYFVQNISKGSVILGIDTNIAERNYYDATTDTLRVFKGHDLTETEAIFDNPATKTITLSEWKEINGTTPLNFQPYVVGERSVESSTKVEACTLDSGENGYKFSLKLNHNSAVIYKYQILNLSGLKDEPIIESIDLDVYLNEDGTFYMIHAVDKYTVKKGISVLTTSIMDYRYRYEATEFEILN